MAAEKVGFKPLHDVKFEFRIKRHSAASQFKSLWDLEVKTPDSDSFETVVQADSLSMAIDKIGYIFEQHSY